MALMPHSFYISALFFSLCTWWARFPTLSTLSQLASFPEPNSKFLGERIELDYFGSSVHPGPVNSRKTRQQGFTSREEEGSFQRVDIVGWKGSPEGT